MVVTARGIPFSCLNWRLSSANTFSTATFCSSPVGSGEPAVGALVLREKEESVDVQKGSNLSTLTRRKFCATAGPKQDQLK